jgi:acyl-CoA thioester hydrolase
MTAQLNITVRYAETDAMGVVHHAAYVVWLEAARVEWMKQIGFPYTRVEQLGVAFSVVELGLTYRASSRFGDEVTIAVWASELSSRQVRFEYRVLNQQQLIAEGFSRHLCTERSGRTVRMPGEVWEGLKGFVGHQNP